MTVTALPARSARRQLSEGDVRAALQKQIPDAAPSDVRSLAQVVVIVWDLVGGLPEADRREIVRGKDRLRTALLQAWPGRRKPSGRRPIEDAGGVEHSRGTGLGERISVVDGRERLDRSVKARPLESWAGPVAGAGEIEHALGIPRSTLSSWHKRGAVIGLLRGERKLAYPLEQFVDARPLGGLSEVLKLAPDARSAWLWLRQPHGALRHRMPLDVLRDGGREAVVRVAERDFV